MMETMRIFPYVLMCSLCVLSTFASVHVPSADSHGNGITGENYSSNHDNGSDAADGHHDDGHSSGIHVASIHFEYVEQPLTIAVFLLIAGISKLGFHHADILSSHVPESCLLIILGVVVGAIMNATMPFEDIPRMGATLFFLYLLPPIILESAYSLHDRTFFENVGTIIIYAVIGTILNCFLIGPTLFGLAKVGAMGNFDIELIPCLVFSAIIVAVDPVAVLAIFQEIGVNNVLYFLVFGESLLNDAVTVVLYNTMKEFNEMPSVTTDQVFLGLAAFFVVSLGGLFIGIIFGVLTAIVTKYTVHVRVVEPLAVFVLAYISYLIAELFHFSGIISIIGCGLVQAQYAFHNISQKSHTTIKYFSKMQSSTSDCIIFLFLGIALFSPNLFDSKNWHPGFILWTLFLCLLYRFLVVFVLTYFVNKTNRMRRIDREEQFIMAYGGLRGAVAFSLVNLLDSGGLPKDMFTSATLCLIFFTVFLQGITIKPLVKILRVKLQENDKLLIISEEINMQVTDHIMAGIEEVIGERGEHYFREILEHYNRKYLNLWLQRDPVSMDEHIMFMFEQIALQQHFENLAGSKMIQDKYASSEVLLPSQLLQKTVYQEEYDSDSSEGTVLPSVTVPSLPPKAMTFDLGEGEADIEFIRRGAEARRETLANIRNKPIFGKRRESKHIENPTVKDVRKMLTPVRREIPAKLDKNLKNESSADLLKCLQEKQLRTRRMSRAVMPGNLPGMEQLLGSTEKIPGRNFNADAATANYRRRLSLAVPAQRSNFIRERSPSDITSLRMMSQFREGDAGANRADFVSETPQKRAHMFKKSHTIDGSDVKEDLSPLIRRAKLDVPSSSPMRNSTGQKFEVISEEEDLSSPEKSPNQKSLPNLKITEKSPSVTEGENTPNSHVVDTHRQPKSSDSIDDGHLADSDASAVKSSPKSRLHKKRSLLQKTRSVDGTKLDFDGKEKSVNSNSVNPRPLSECSPLTDSDKKSDLQGSSLRKSSYITAISKTDSIGEKPLEHSNKGDNSIEMENISQEKHKEDIQ
ncbi:Na(+)/H(+) exchanger protein 7-like [Argopecten irradians]|uniref:Na(+)/H(+) exchanger protein 7-like n=1 Tax=Argopecten irradians TaxID=31199 RepID=UPI00371746D6